MNITPLKNLALEMIILIVLMVYVVASVYIDIKVLENHLAEVSMTELSQSGFVLIAAINFFRMIKKEPDSAGLFILISGFFGMIFFREADYYFDGISHSFWQIPVSIILLSTVFFAYKNKLTILDPIAQYQSTKAFTYTFIGVLVTIIFSRLFGTGSLWREIAVADGGYIKTVVQEGIELLGYSLILFGSFIVHCKKLGSK